MKAVIANAKMAVASAEPKVKNAAHVGSTVASASLVGMYFLNKLSFINEMPANINVALGVVLTGALTWVSTFLAGWRTVHIDTPVITPVASESQSGGSHTTG